MLRSLWLEISLEGERECRSAANRNAPVSHLNRPRRLRAGAAFPHGLRELCSIQRQKRLPRANDASAGTAHRRRGTSIETAAAMPSPASAPAHPGLLAAPLWRREPYRLLFPLGALLAWAGVLPWLLLATRLSASYPSTYHAMAQVQGFLTCFAAGFLLTFIPRRTGTAAPPGWLVVTAALAPVLTVVFALAERWTAAQGCWLFLLVSLAGFVALRSSAGGGARRTPPSFVWVPFSLAATLAASVAAALGAIHGPYWLHSVGSWVVLQGLFTGLVLGIGGFLLPVILRGEPPPALAPGRQKLLRVFHAVAASAYFAGFFVEAQVSVRAGFALRSFVCAAVLLAAFRRRTLPGLHRSVALAAAWCVPLGNLLVALFPTYRQLGLHVLFIGGFASLTLCVAAHVTISHSGRSELLRGTPWSVAITAGLLVSAVAARGLVLLDAGRSLLWLGVAAAAFLAAVIAWGMWISLGRRARLEVRS